MPVAIKKTSKKRKAAYVLFLIIVTLVVLYSYCYGKSICYTMPLFTDWSRVTLTETKHGLVLTSSVVLKTGVAEKHGNYRGETNGKTRLMQGNENATTVNVANTGNLIYKQVDTIHRMVKAGFFFRDPLLSQKQTICVRIFFKNNLAL